MASLDIYDTVKLFGFLLVVSATYLATVKIPRLDKDISEIEGEITSFKDSRVMTTLSALSYGQQFTQRRIELFESNQILLLTKDKKATEVLRQRALDHTISLAKQWAFLLGGEKAESLKKETEEKINNILIDSKLDSSTKFEKIEAIWKENQKAASIRLADAHKSWHANEKKIKKIKSTRKCWNSMFAWLQIVGLILFSGAEIIDKLSK